MTPPRKRRDGFTLVEVLLVASLTVLLARLLANTWQSMGRGAVDAAARSRLTQEANLARAALAADLGGSPADSAARIGVKTQARFVGRLQPGNSQLWLCFDGGSTPNGLADWGPPDTVIVYSVQGTQLMRTNQSTGVSVAIAGQVQALAVQDLGDRVQIQLTFAYRDLTRTYTLIARDP